MIENSVFIKVIRKEGIPLIGEVENVSVCDVMASVKDQMWSGILSIQLDQESAVVIPKEEIKEVQIYENRP